MEKKEDRTEEERLRASVAEWTFIALTWAMILMVVAIVVMGVGMFFRFVC